MKFTLLAVFLVILFHQYVAASEPVRGRVESCPGCKLNKLRDVKKFIYEDLPKYADITFKKIQGSPPELVILDAEDNEVERIPLEDKNREECNLLLLQKGFRLKLSTDMPKAEL